ncbi:hypothetical protein BGW80DRAFT_626460 [Lactifluus volemus]|nr:hypothetical protein BGW80DRAFT_626460 [Lactifluus volemus]
MNKVDRVAKLEWPRGGGLGRRRGHVVIGKSHVSEADLVHWGDAYHQTLKPTNDDDDDDPDLTIATAATAALWRVPRCPCPTSTPLLHFSNPSACHRELEAEELPCPRPERMTGTKMMMWRWWIIDRSSRLCRHGEHQDDLDCLTRGHLGQRD